MVLIQKKMISSKFSVLISIYQKESPQFLNSCLESIHQQSLYPNEIIVVSETYLESKCHLHPFLLSIGISACQYELIARMDADDICFQDRFQKQISYISEHPEVDVISSWIDEFITDPSELIAIRKVPEYNQDIISFHKKRNALNHMAVVFKKSKVIEAGSYTHMPYFEDYFLWSKMMRMGMKFHNIQESLVFARIGADMIGRRHGLSYIRAEFNNYVALRNIDFINNFEMIKMLIIRLPLRLLPKSILKWLYKSFIH